MPISDSKRKADKKWRSENYDRLNIHLPKGARDRWKRFADSQGIALRQLISQAVEDYIKRSGGDSNDY